MNIYVSHARSFDFKKELYEPLKGAGLNCIFPHEDESFINSKDLFTNKKCDLVLAEVSYPSTGQGIELAWANENNIPIVCVYKKDFDISGSLKLVTDKFIEYKDTNDMIEKLKSVI